MKILMVDLSKGWGGAQELTLALARRLRDRGHFPVFAARSGSPVETAAAGAGFGCCSVRRGGAGTVGGMVALLRYARQERVDIVHAHRNHDLVAGKLAAVAAGAPLVLTQHCLLGKSSGAVIALPDRVAAVSAFVAEGITQRFPGLRGKTVVIHNGIDMPGEVARDFWTRVPELSGKGPFLGVVGSFYKNQEELLGVVARLRTEFPGLVLVLIGRDDDRKPQLAARVAELGVGEAVWFAGAVPHDRIPEALAGLDLQVSAFRMEGFGLGVVEGMAAGTPFVGYRGGAFGEIVSQGEDGLLVETPEEMVGAISSLLRDRDSLQAMSRKGMAKVFSRFSMERMVAAYEELYLSVTDHRVSGRN